MKPISTKNAPAAVGPYSQAVLVKDTLYVSGQIPFVPETMTLVSDSIKDQTRQSLNNILAIVKEAGMKKENIIKCGVFMQDLGMFKDMNEVYALDVLVEIDAIVVK